ncbi:MAG: hypothetical protein DRO67_02390 [Candidatus Asgardarchaeum californiense]|nr:MAG: hypothetical protein DRO67_02390 [Candidatus Asgardarchaeum californiense]
MFNELKNIFGGTNNLSRIVAVIMLRLPLIFVGELDASTIHTLIQLACPHRLFITLPSADPNDVDTIISAETKEPGKRVIIFIPNLINLPKSTRGWVATVPEFTSLNELNSAFVYDLEKNKFLRQSQKIAFILPYASSIVNKVLRIEGIFDYEEASLYGKSFFTSLLSEIEIINNYVLSNYKSVPKDEFRSWFFSIVDQFSTHKEYLLLGIYIYSQEYNDNLLRILKQNFGSVSELASQFEMEQKLHLKPNFMGLTELLNVDIISRTLTYVLMGFPIVFKCPQKYTDLILDTLAFVVKHRKIFHRYTAKSKSIAHSHLYVLKNIKKLPALQLDFIATTQRDTPYLEIQEREFFVAVDVYKKTLSSSIQLPPILSDILHIDNEQVVEEYITNYVNRLLIQSELLQLHSSKFGFSFAFPKLKVNLTQFEKLLLIGILRAENPTKESLLEILKLQLSMINPYSYQYLKFTKPITKELIFDLIKDSYYPQAILRILALHTLNLPDIWSISSLSRVNAQEFFYELEQLINKGVVRLE